jgi:DNA replication protein DnaC
MWCSAKEITDDKAVAIRARLSNLVVIDDLGKESETPAAIAAIRDVISKRYDLKLPTIITTELTILDIRVKYGQYIAERLTEDYCSRCIDCRGESLRLLDGGAAE